MQGLIRHQSEKPHTGGRSAAVMLFYNDEGGVRLMDLSLSP